MLFSASLSVVESPLKGLFSGRNSCVYVSDNQTRCTYILRSGLTACLELTGKKVVVAIHEATLLLHLNSHGSPRWLNLLEVTA